MGDLAKIFKAYDVRGVVPDELDEPTAEAVGAAFVEVTGAGSVVVAHDMRESSPLLADAFIRGARSRRADVVHAGLGSTDLLYYASGSLGLPGVMFTASHNPARYNGMKMCRSGAVPIGGDTGLTEIRDRAAQLVGVTATPSGSLIEKDLLKGYADHLRSLVDLRGIRPLKVVVDAGNGMGGHTVPAVFEGLPIELTPLYFELDGTFPNHEANPLEPQNLVDLQRAVVDNGADIGLAFDGDADRCWVIDERGESVSPSAITALVATRELAKYPGSTIIHNLITSLGVPEIVREHGGVPVRTRVGHSFIKAEMARSGAVFGGEHSAHYYFRDFWFADSGLLAAMHVLAALGEQERPLSQVVGAYSRYHASGEINSQVSDQAEALRRVREAFEGRGEPDELDGLTVRGDGWWFNLRPSNTEPLLRLNAEAADESKMTAIRDEVLAIVGKVSE
ncbi:Phosphomannomutase [[Actinomadura] parvosata subsp. kistnae]|uniref:Phosphomannomutase/phosphoglucomutase n=1 Tax=[Actinomadura] parvosata subsp. kistnae TaxID=1909395 RepID=A0A1V0A8R2_9ACTN|nr:phosphomannomutase/phosphoglucomutase [Nonomuraea sp. ATCC 55076]AQZ66597.1 phosphomannomutase/phosphoglucomutase [Nonomuraea sp. ATCC 55076]SPL95318.1 Phosphomannomutase [Actinomadura parvosata subsp. kistnae]